MTTADERAAQVAILEYLATIQGDDVNKAQALLASAFGVDGGGKSTHALPTLLAAGRRALGDEPTSPIGTSAPGAGADGDDDPQFAKFVAKLEASKFFAGAEPGSEEHTRRLEKARAKFYARRSAPAVAPAPAAVPATREEADKLKAEGNALLKSGDHSAAVKAYTSAIELDGTNAIYYSNRAAAKMHLKEYAAAVDDCKMAVSIDATYPRAHERLASAYRALGMHEAELEALETGTRAVPDNKQLSALLEDAKNRHVVSESGGSAGAGAGTGTGAGMPGMPSPEELANMASSMGMPGVSPEMVRGFMDSPMASQMAAAFGGGGGPPGGGAGGQGGAPGMAEMMEMVRNNPQMMQSAMAMLQSDPDMLSKMMGAFGGAGAGGNDPDKNPPPGSV